MQVEDPEQNAVKDTSSRELKSFKMKSGGAVVLEGNTVGGCK